MHFCNSTTNPTLSDLDTSDWGCLVKARNQTQYNSGLDIDTCVLGLFQDYSFLD